jgi:bifunctional non-homologous end joining protein LigD
MTMKSADLFYHEGNSDKEYHLQIVEKASGSYSVECQWGRVGSTMQTQVKISNVGLSVAEKMYNKVYNEKVGKGYIDKTKLGNGGYSSPKASSLVVSTMIPQLLNPIEESELEKYLRDDAYGAQEKKDGKHFILRIFDGVVSVFNKKGKEVGYPLSWKEFAREFWKGEKISCILDGEGIGETFHVFDLLEIGGEDKRGEGYFDRWTTSNKLSFGASIQVVSLAIGYKAKRALYDELVADKKEGIVFKRLDALYKPGRPSSGGDMVKYKFVATVSVRVCKGREGKRSIGMEILNGDKWEFIGNCTVSANKGIPLLGVVVEIRYLYVQGKGGHLYQPVYIGKRDDVEEGECVISQLKYKAEED